MSEAGPLRVLLTGDTVGGVWTFILELAESLIRENVEVCLATLGRKATSDQELQIRSLGKLLWYNSGYKLEWMDNPWEDVALSRTWLLSIQESFQPDVVHLNTLVHGDLPWGVPTVLTIHSCVPTWWAAVKKSPLCESWSRYRQEVERSLAAATLITAPTRALLRAAGEQYAGLLNHARVVHNGRNHSGFYSAHKEPRIFSAGRLYDEAKNVTALVQVAGSLPWAVELAGDPPDQNGSAPVNGEGCRWLGRLTPSEMAHAYARAAIYALPARYEPFGLSILEAALSRCALVLGDIPSLREVWQDSALFVPPDDHQRLEFELRRLIEDSALREQMGRSALARAKEFTPEKTAFGYLDAYESALRTFMQRRHACAS